MIPYDDRRMGWPYALLNIDQPTEYKSAGVTPVRPRRTQEVQDAFALKDAQANHIMTMNLERVEYEKAAEKTAIADALKKTTDGLRGLEKGFGTLAGALNTLDDSANTAEIRETLVRGLNRIPWHKKSTLVLLHEMREYAKRVLGTDRADDPVNRTTTTKDRVDWWERLFNIIVGTGWKKSTPPVQGWYTTGDDTMRYFYEECNSVSRVVGMRDRFNKDMLSHLSVQFDTGTHNVPPYWKQRVTRLQLLEMDKPAVESRAKLTRSDQRNEIRVLCRTLNARYGEEFRVRAKYVFIDEFATNTLGGVNDSDLPRLMNRIEYIGRELEEEDV